MKRVLAVAVAVLLVAIALAARNAIDDDDEEAVAAGNGGEGDAGDEPLVVACVRELRAACEALDAGVRIEDPAATIESAGDIDAWITFDPWPAMADIEAGREVFGDGAVPVAGSDLALLARTAALPASCGGTADWACVADASGSSAPTLPPAGTALGRLLLGHAALAWNAVARDGQPFARNEFELPEFDDWRQALRFSRDPLADMIQLAPAGPVATGTTGATLETVVETSREADRLDAEPTAVPATVAVVVAGPEAARVAADQRLLDGLAALGWDVDPNATTTGLPEPGVLLALEEIAR
jgi:hypothetical protein